MKRVFKPYIAVMAALTIAAAIVLAGCSTVLYERKKDEKNPMDEGMETCLKLQGPKAVVKTQF